MRRPLVAQVTALGGRENAALSSDGRLRVRLRDPDAALASVEPGTSPEQLFAAAYASCFLASIREVADARGQLLAPDCNVTATLVAAPAARGGVSLDLSIDIPNLSPVEAAKLVERARAQCPFVQDALDRFDVGFDIA